MRDSLRLATQELASAWDAVDRMRRAEMLDQLNVEWASVLNHLEKLWVKTGLVCKAARPDFPSWNSSWVSIRESDPLLVYLRQARHADNHSSQFLSCEVIGHLILAPGRALGFAISDTPELVVRPVKNRGVIYPVPETHLGQLLGTRDPRELSVHGCNFYAEYLGAVRSSFLCSAP